MAIIGNSLGLGHIETGVRCTIKHSLHGSMARQGAMDLEGYTYKVVLFPSIFLNNVWLQFCSPVQDVLDMVGMVLA